MSAIPGTNVAAMVVPFDDQDIFATHNDKYGRGGFRVCNTMVEMNAISSLRRKAGMWVKVIETGLVYELAANETTWFEIDFKNSGASSNPLLFSRYNEDVTNLQICQAVFAFSSTGVRRAVATEASGAWRVLGIVTETILQGNGGKIQAEGTLIATTAEWDAVTGEVGGLVKNRAYFLHPSSVGMITQLPPDGDGEYLCRIGTAYSPTEMYIDIGSCIKL